MSVIFQLNEVDGCNLVLFHSRSILLDLAFYQIWLQWTLNRVWMSTKNLVINCRFNQPTEARKPRLNLRQVMKLYQLLLSQIDMTIGNEKKRSFFPHEKRNEILFKLNIINCRIFLKCDVVHYIESSFHLSHYPDVVGFRVPMSNHDFWPLLLHILLLQPWSRI